MRDLLGYEPAEVLGRTPYDLMPPGEAERVAEAVRPYFEQAQPFTHVENTNRHKDGRLVMLDTSGVPVFDEQGVLRGFRGIDRDITERKRDEEALRESEARFRLFMHMSVEGIWRLEIDLPVPTDRPEREQAELILQRLRVGEANDAFARRYGRPRPEDLVGVLVDDLWKDTHEAKIEFMLRFIRGGYRGAGLETFGRDPSGRPVWSLNNLTGEVEEGLLLGMWGTQLNITGRKQAEEALRESEQRFRAIVESTRDWIWFCDAKGTHRYSNQAVETMLGYAPEEIVGKAITRFMHPEDVPGAAEMERAVAERKGWSNFVIRWRHKDGTYHYLESAATPAFDSQGTLQGWYGADRDITERVHMQQALLESETRLRALFAAMRDVILVMDAEGRYLEIVPTQPDLLYRPAEELLGKTVHEVFPPEQAEYFVSHIAQALETGETHQMEYNLPIGERVLRFGAMVSPLSHDTVIVVARISPRWSSSENSSWPWSAPGPDLAEHLNDEINHRARNNLAMISGLLQAQASHASDPRVAAPLREAVARIRTFVNLHERIYAIGAEEADLLEVLQEVAATLRGDFSEVRAEFSVEGESSRLPTWAATNLAVVANRTHDQCAEIRSSGGRRWGPGEGPPAPGSGADCGCPCGIPEIRFRGGSIQKRKRVWDCVWSPAWWRSTGGSFELRPEHGGSRAEVVIEEASLER